MIKPFFWYFKRTETQKYSCLIDSAQNRKNNVHFCCPQTRIWRFIGKYNEERNAKSKIKCKKLTGK